MNPYDGQTMSLAFPGATLGAMPAKGGGNAAKGGGNAAKADAATQSALDAGEAGGPYRVADGMGFDEIIDPRQIRNAILDGLILASARAGGSRAPTGRFDAPS